MGSITRIGPLTALVVFVAGCGGSALDLSSSTSEPSVSTSMDPAQSVPVDEGTFAWSIDPSIQEPGNVEVVSDGVATSRFVPGRIVVVFDDAGVLEDMVERYRGTVVRQFSAGDYGVAGPSVAVVEVDPSTADLDSLGSSMTALGASGDDVFGSEAGARVGAIAAFERAAGRSVSLDWMTVPAGIPFSTEEQGGAQRDWDPDAYQLSYYRLDSVQGIGVAEAWSMMYYAGVLDNSVPIAILDRGFTIDEDFSAPRTWAMEPTYLGFGESDDGWHGYQTASVAAAIPDNGFGIAGVAGVVADPILIQLGDPEMSADMEAIFQATAMGARIISMSFICPILDEWAELGVAWDAVTAAVAADGVLLFASAGNGGGNVDDAVAERPGLVGTRPCQGPGVICVGGLGFDSVERHEDSTHGNVGGTVDIYAPYCVHTFPPLETRSIFWSCGTSFSAPFAAGVAALVWASNPALTAEEVWDLMASTSRGDRWPRVNAFDAVAGALGPFTGVRFVEPERGSRHDLGVSVSLAAMVSIPTSTEPAGVPVDVRFSSDRDGLLDEHTWTVSMHPGEPVSLQRVSAVVSDLSEGTHAITVWASYAGHEAEDTREISVGNSPPSDLRITMPTEGAEYCPGGVVQLRGDAFDINQQLGLPESAFRWRSDRDGAIGRGRNTSVDDLSAGLHQITLRVVDAGGLQTSRSVSIRVLSAAHPDCVDRPPDVSLVDPGDGAAFWVDDPEAETGVDALGAWVEVTIRAVVTDDRDVPGDLTVDLYVTPGEADSWAGTGPLRDVRLHLEDGLYSQVKTIRVVVFDSGGNRSEDAIEVSVNRFF